MQRVHVYFYDPSGRLAQETVEGCQRNFTYDPRGLLASAEQIGTQKHSKVERSYDAEGRLILETVYLDGTLIQQTEQTWESSNRSLQIGDHTRDFIYQNNQLVHISTQEVDLS